MSSEAGDARKSPIMTNGNLVARISLTKSKNVKLIQSLDALTEDLEREIRARCREDPAR